MTDIRAVGDEDRFVVYQALRRPRGFYDANRASQLSGVPLGTINHWARSELLTPDWNALTPRGWSYRDLLYLRLFALLRKQGMETSGTSERVRLIRDVLASETIDPTVRSDGQHAFLSGETIDRFSGQQAFDGVTALLSIFEIAQPIDKVSKSAMWGPGLVCPSAHTHISPWVLSGEPCVAFSRIPTSALFVLRQERRLPAERIRLLYPQIRVEAIQDAINLEKKLRLGKSRAYATGVGGLSLFHIRVSAPRTATLAVPGASPQKDGDGLASSASTGDHSGVNRASFGTLPAKREPSGFRPSPLGRVGGTPLGS